MLNKSEINEYDRSGPLGQWDSLLSCPKLVIIDIGKKLNSKSGIV